MAIENNVALLSHDHSGTSGGTSRLFQMNTHQSPDTDSSTSSLHHTVGAGATQAAAGNHTHTQLGTLQTSVNNLAVQDLGGTSRLVAPVVEVYYTGGNVAINGDVWAAGGWSLAGPNIDTDGMFSFQGGYASIQIPISGRYFIHYHTVGISNPGPIVSRVTLTQNVTISVVAGSQSVSTNGLEIQLDAIGMKKLTAGNRLYWANWATNNFTLRANMFGEDSFVVVRYMGPN